MNMKDICTILRVIDAMKTVGLKTSGNGIAKNIASWSRATTYRKLKKLRKMGLIYYGTSSLDNEPDCWRIKAKGHDFLALYKELPL